MSDSKIFDRLRAIPASVWIALVLLIIALFFILQNRVTTSIKLFNFSIIAPLWAILVVTIAVGIIIGLLIRRNPRKAGQKAKTSKAPSGS